MNNRRESPVRCPKLSQSASRPYPPPRQLYYTTKMCLLRWHAALLIHVVRILLYRLSLAPIWSHQNRAELGSWNITHVIPLPTVQDLPVFRQIVHGTFSCGFGSCGSGWYGYGGRSARRRCIWEKYGWGCGVMDNVLVWYVIICYPRALSGILLNT